MPWNRANRKRFNVGEYMRTQHLASVEAIEPVEKAKTLKAKKQKLDRMDKKVSLQ